MADWKPPESDPVVSAQPGAWKPPATDLPPEADAKTATAPQSEGVLKWLLPQSLQTFREQAEAHRGGVLEQIVHHPVEAFRQAKSGIEQQQQKDIEEFRADLKRPIMERAFNPSESEQIAENLAFGFGPGPIEAVGARPMISNAPREQALVENQARAAISNQFQKGVQGGAPTASDVHAEIQRAKREGQPLALVDVNNPSLGALAGATYREGGAARATMKGFLETRGAAAPARTQDIIERHLADDSYRATANQLIATRSTNSKPLWDEARSGGSIAPLEHQFTAAFNEIGKTETVARKALRATQNRLTQGRAGQSQAGNVYAASGANRATREAEDQLRQANATVVGIQAQKSAILERLRQAQADRTADAPGAVWSPRLQELLDQPEVQQGLRRGYAIERRNAVGAGRPFNPSEYAVIGEDKSGNPIVGKVPNMSLLMVAKEGLDAAIESPAMKNPLTGRPTKAGLSYIALRDGLVDELDRLNPAYKQARDAWSGDTASLRALDDGRNFLSQGRFSPEELGENVAKMTDSDRQFFTIGVADALKNKLFRGADARTGTRGIINTEDARLRLRPLFGGDDAAAQEFIDAMEREQSMKQTATRVYGGSPTAERQVDDRTSEAALHAAHGIIKVLEGRWLSAAASALRTRRLFGARPNPALSEAIARALVDPDIGLSEVGPLLPPKAVPQRPMPTPSTTGPALPFRAGAAAFGQNQNQSDDTLGYMPP